MGRCATLDSSSELIDGEENTANRQRQNGSARGRLHHSPCAPQGHLNKLLFRHSDQEAQAIKEYVEWQARGPHWISNAGLSVWILAIRSESIRRLLDRLRNFAPLPCLS